MKLKKIIALYSTISPPPLLFIYKCSNCKYYIKDFDCIIVCRGGLPDLNIINPESWCVLWMNRDNDVPFNWIFEIN